MRYLFKTCNVKTRGFLNFTINDDDDPCLVQCTIKKDEYGTQKFELKTGTNKKKCFQYSFISMPGGFSTFLQQYYMRILDPT